jgi:CDP-6-deoxy-D-xylo-4-hexulose-3-dehydrase
VLVPAIAWATTYAPLVQYGLELTLMDCDETWNANVYAKSFDPTGVRLMIGCSILGSPAELEAMQTAAGVIEAYFVEDNCESLGAVTGDGHLCGTFGDLSTFSFFWSHQISAIEGGMILTDDDELAGLCRMLRAHGWSRDVEPPACFEDEYDFRLFGYNVRGLELHAAIAREQLRKLPGFIAARTGNAEAFRQAGAGLPVTFQGWGGDPSPFGLSFRTHDGPTRNRVVAALRAAGIDCRLPTGGSFRLHGYGEPWRGQETPNADLVHDTGLFLGNGPFAMEAEIAAAIAVLKGVL